MSEHSSINPNSSSSTAEAVTRFQLALKVNGPHDLAPETGKLYSLIDKTAEGIYLDLVQEWSYRATNLHSSSEQAPTLTIDGLGWYYSKISLYHGSKTAGITEFMPAEETTIGRGLYATSMPDQAFGYATVRAKSRNKVGASIFVTSPHPVVYEVEVKDVSFLDLRNREITIKVMKDYAQYLDVWLAGQWQKDGLTLRDEEYLDIVAEKLKIIHDAEGRAPNIKDVLQQTGLIFNEFVHNLGYDGIVAKEGGEGGYTGEHDSWVIMKPAKAQVSAEKSFLTPHVFDDDAWQAHRAEVDKLFNPLPFDVK